MTPAARNKDAELLNTLWEDVPDTQRALHSRLAEAAEKHGILDVAYRFVETPVGTLLLAATERGLVRVAYDIEGHDAVLGELSRVISPRILKAPARLETAAREIDEYFAGRRFGFEIPLDLRLARGFRLAVLRHLPEIAYGQTATYTWVAAAAGSPKAVRAAGSACATNPIPLVIPCHRVVRSDGSLGGYGGGSEVKQALLELEGHTQEN